MNKLSKIAAASVALVAVSCSGEQSAPVDGATTGDAAASDVVDVQSIDSIAESFVKLALELGNFDKAYVDAYQGPEEWAEQAKASKRGLEALKLEAQDLIEAVEKTPEARTPRGKMLRMELVAAHTRMRMAQGERLPFDEETRLLYDVVAPQYDLTEFDAALAEIEALLPGSMPLSERVEQFRLSLSIPPGQLEAVFEKAVEACRSRTLAHYTLPENERFSIGYVTDKPWSGYNWYQGDFESLIEINTDFPIFIGRAIDLGCHEAYPGHHTWNIFSERDFLKGEGWIEYVVYPLFSPQSLIGEGSANYGIELAFPGDEKIEFERDVLFPIAGLNPEKAETYAALAKLTRKLSHSRNHVARAFLDGDIDREEAISLIQKYQLVSRPRAEKSLSFIEAYRGYVLNYNIGLDLVTAYIDAQVAEGVDRWVAFEELLTTPRSASDLIARAE
ncbi:MAG: hypothetical protein AAF850_10235 [Pseudomonadota bacterium]